jgi:hypothetical protein
MTNKFRFWALMTPGCISDPIEYTFLKFVNFSHGSEKGAKNSCGSYPTEFVFEVKNDPVIRKEKSLS